MIRLCTTFLFLFLYLGLDLTLGQDEGFTPTTDTDFESLVLSALKEAEEMMEADRNASMRQTRAATNGPVAMGHTYVKFTELTESIGESSNRNLLAYQILLQNGATKDQAIGELYNHRHSFCSQGIMRCNPTAKYRTSNGTCNNLNHPFWGASFIPFNRIVPNFYHDSFNTPTGGGKTTPSKFPNPRVISTTIHPDRIQSHARVTNMLPQFGQFLDHDITLTPEGDKRCCSGIKHNDCLEIPIPGNDSFYSTLLSPQTCMDFTRSTPFCFPTTTGTREQFNILTAYIDASNVYGSEDERLNLVRSFFRGLLRTSRNNPKYLPTKAQLENLTGTEIHFMGTFVAGDERVNEMPALTTMHTLFLREHNKIAHAIYTLKPTLSDETIFQEARRILIAQMQNIVYGEYLPILLGAPAMNLYGLTLDDGQSFYDSSVDASIFHSFATAAYRFGHTFLNGLVQLMVGLTNVGSYRIRDNFFVSNQLTMDGGKGYDRILGGLMLQNAQNYDPFVTEDFTNFVLRLPTEEFGADLVARNLQRGRDHGIQPWMSYRRFCGLSTSTNWAQIPADVRPDSWALLQTLYTSPLEVDLFTGGLVERPQGAALTGGTFNCLKAHQFQRLKKGDRFFFTHAGEAGSFTLPQMQHLRRRTLGDIICENSEVTMTPRNVFLIRGASNPLVNCTDTSRTKLDFALLLS